MPLWPHSPYPDGYTAEGIADTLIAALERNGITGVYAFANSWALLERPELAGVLDRWVGAGHHIANHTHSHPVLTEVSAERYIKDIDLAERHLEPWLSKAPRKFFRYTLNQWGDTEDKRTRVKAHLDERGYAIAEVTSWFFEWEWNRAYENAIARGDGAALDFLRRSFLEFSAAQFTYDAGSATEWFGHDVTGIALGHNVPFFADMADAYFAELKQAGVDFISLEEAATDAAYAGAAGIVSTKFLVYHQKFAHAEGRPIPRIVPEMRETYDRVREMMNGAT